jgi:GNAT superfamily N-acetyltransferase
MDGFYVVPARPEEIPFVVDSWARSFRDSPWAGCVNNECYQAAYRDSINGLLVRGASVSVVVPAEGVRRVLAYIVIEDPDILHYLYVKRNARGLGLAKELLSRRAPTPRRFTFRTPASSLLLKLGHTWDPVPARLSTFQKHSLDKDKDLADAKNKRDRDVAEAAGAQQPPASRNDRGSGAPQGP